MQLFLLLFKKTLSSTNIRFLLLFAFVFFLWADITLANEPMVSQEAADKVVWLLNWFIAIAATLLWMVTAFITLFIYPWWTNGTLFGLTEYLRDIWVLVSNVVYFIFAFILVTIAFMNIINKWEWNWELKQALPRFIVWVLIVPFTWFLVQFILSISAVLTVAVLSLPYDIFAGRVEDDVSDSEILNTQICNDIIIVLQWDPNTVGTSLSDSPEANQMMESVRCRSDGNKSSILQIVTGQDWWEGIRNSMFGIISVYTYGILRVQELTKVSIGDVSAYKQVLDLVLKIVFDVLFIAVYLLLMIALLLALFTRGIKLWIFIMLSPIFGLMYFFWKLKEWWNEKYSPTEFIALAMVPVYVSAALAFWLTFILVSTEWIKDTVWEGQSLDQLNLWGFKLEIMGNYWDWDLELGIIGKLITQIFWVAILWIAVMAALGASKNTAAIVKPIADFWESVWKLAAAAPTYAPIIPTWWGPWSGMSVAGLWTFWSQLETSIRWAAQSRGSDFARQVMPSWWNNNISQLREMFSSSWITSSTPTNNGQRADLIQQALNTHGQEIVNDARMRAEFEERLREIWIEVNLTWVWNNPQQIAERLYPEIQNLQWIQQIFPNQQALIDELRRISQQTPPAATWASAPWATWTTTVDVNWGNINITANGATAPTQIPIPSWNNVFTDPAQITQIRSAFVNRATFVTAISSSVTDSDRQESLADSIWFTS